MHRACALPPHGSTLPQPTLTPQARGHSSASCRPAAKASDTRRLASSPKSHIGTREALFGTEQSQAGPAKKHETACREVWKRWIQDPCYIRSYAQLGYTLAWTCVTKYAHLLHQQPQWQSFPPPCHTGNAVCAYHAAHTSHATPTRRISLAWVGSRGTHALPK